MGVALLPANGGKAQEAAGFFGRLPILGACFASVLAALIALGFAAALIAVGWKYVPAALTASVPQGAAAAIWISLVLVVLTMPATLAIAVLAAACAWDINIGGTVGRTLRGWLVFSTSVPAVVVGATVFLLCAMLGLRVGIWTALAAVVALNVPRTTARIVRMLGYIPAQTIDATAAAGAAPAFAFFAVALRTIRRPLAALALALCAQLLGQAAVIVLAGGLTGDQPLAVQIWKFAPDVRLAGFQGAQSLLLVAACGFFVAASGAVSSYRPRRRISAARASLGVGT
ncbi:MAG: hypothetical protein ACR2KS_08090 [Candidatus Eremiobacter antarcticus]|nr:ABC transporter permease subunit [Candidatus Eremiobacteraeota bacterium]MBC5808284.1 ABC transporter permease subunit [Candidatus Eremiobacteraeota bacterium]